MFWEGLLPPQFILNACLWALSWTQHVRGLVAIGVVLLKSSHEEEVSCLLVWAARPQKGRAQDGELVTLLQLAPSPLCTQTSNKSQWLLESSLMCRIKSKQGLLYSWKCEPPKEEMMGDQCLISRILLLLLLLLIIPVYTECPLGVIYLLWRFTPNKVCTQQ